MVSWPSDASSLLNYTWYHSKIVIRTAQSLKKKKKRQYKAWSQIFNISQIQHFQNFGTRFTVSFVDSQAITGNTISPGLECRESRKGPRTEGCLPCHIHILFNLKNFLPDIFPETNYFICLLLMRIQLQA